MLTRAAVAQSWAVAIVVAAVSACSDDPMGQSGSADTTAGGDTSAGFVSTTTAGGAQSVGSTSTSGDGAGSTGSSTTSGDDDAWWCMDPDQPVADLVTAIVIGGQGPDAGTLFVELGNYAFECGDTTAPPCPATWRLSIGLTPRLQAPGVYDLLHPDVPASYRFSTSGDTCGLVTGPALEGALGVASIHDGEVVGRLCNTPRTLGFDWNGTFVAKPCP